MGFDRRSRIGTYGRRRRGQPGLAHNEGMSGPVSTVDVPAARIPPDEPAAPCAEVTESRLATVGGMPVRRALPRRGRRTIGAWCFVDIFGPAAVTDGQPVEIGPHPHIGLQTVTWLHAGEQVHRDSLGTEQLVRPGQLNLMTAGHGVAHAEESEHYRGLVSGVQLWVALPESTRHGSAAFEHHRDLPEVDLATATATVLVGALAGEQSAARADTPLLGLDLMLRSGRTVLPLERSYEHAVVVLEGQVKVCDAVVAAGSLAYVGRGRDELPVEALAGGRALLLGGEPFGESVLMWWNFVARTRDEVTAARAEWQSGSNKRFAATGSPLPRIPAPPVPWTGRAGPRDG